MVERRQRRSAAAGAAAADMLSAAPIRSAWGRRLAYALVLVGAVSAVSGIVALGADLGAMGNAGVPQGPLDFLPVVVGAALGVCGAALLVRGGLGVIRPGTRLTGGRPSALLGVLLQLPAALAVGALTATLPLTVAYLGLLAGLAAAVWRLLPVPAAPPLARHPAPSEEGRGLPSRAPRWSVQRDPEPLQWVSHGAPPPPSAGPATTAADGPPERRRRAGS
ncbi:MAG: hypothetical protein M0T72_04005 [Candidatus Dormibacteraeota bacterium]|nr:hypothetical protein [Candidatus Dormibacteraeota bacterium]